VTSEFGRARASFSIRRRRPKCGNALQAAQIGEIIIC
jgi:hypothetical protein